MLRWFQGADLYKILDVPEDADQSAVKSRSARDVVRESFWDAWMPLGIWYV